MICHLPGDPLHTHARHALSFLPNTARSVRDLCLMYSLPHPLCLLDNPPKKSSFKTLVKKSMRQYWEQVLIAEAAELKSLTYFHPTQCSLSQPGLAWLAAKGSSFECAKSTIVCKMISGRYRSESLCRHWSATNKLGHCLASTCTEVVGDLEHILVVCPALEHVRERLRKMWLERTSQSPALNEMIKMVFISSPPVQVQFILDPTLFDGVNMLVELYGIPVLLHVMYLTRTYAYYMHREKLILQGRWPGDFGRKQQKIPALASRSAQTKSLRVSQASNMNNCITIINNSLVPGPDVTSPDNPDQVPAISPATTTSTGQHYYQPFSHCVPPHTKTQYQPVPGHDSTTWTDLLCTTGLSGVPHGGGQAATDWRGGVGQGGGDEVEL